MVFWGAFIVEPNHWSEESKVVSDSSLWLSKNTFILLVKFETKGKWHSKTGKTNIAASKFCGVFRWLAVFLWVQNNIQSCLSARKAGGELSRSDTFQRVPSLLTMVVFQQNKQSKHADYHLNPRNYFTKFQEIFYSSNEKNFLLVSSSFADTIIVEKKFETINLGPYLYISCTIKGSMKCPDSLRSMWRKYYT